MKGVGFGGGLKGGLLLEWVCFGVLVGMVEAVFLMFLFGCGYFVNDCIDLIFGLKSIFFWIIWFVYICGLIFFFCTIFFYDFSVFDLWVCALVCS